MYNLIKDSIITPKNLLQYRNKSGLFTFFYLVFLSVIVSIYAFVFIFSYQNNEVITTASTTCEFQPSGLVCAEPVTDGLNLYDFRFYFLNESDTIPTLLADQALVYQGKIVTVFVEGEIFLQSPLYIGDQSMPFDQVMSTFQSMFAFLTIFGAIIGSMVLLFFMAIVSTMPFFRLKQFISFNKILKLVIFAITPLAILLAFYNLLQLPEWSFILLMLLGYRSLLLLQRELYYQTYLRVHAKSSPTSPDGDPEAPIEIDPTIDSTEPSEEADETHEEDNQD